MTADLAWLELKEQLLELLELPEPARQARVQSLRETLPDRAAALESLLSQATDGFLETPAWKRLAAPQAVDPPPPARIGPWRVEAEIGHGGMGRVFRGRRDDGAFEQRVAIKLVRAEYASPSMRRRFLAERRILAGLEHPGIARLLEGGATPEGTPYLVLEYVDGVPIDSWCDARHLPVHERLALFRKVCAAVDHAHQRLVLHRDIKTANVLVDEQGQPKLLDFGIAKLTSAAGAEEDLTVFAAMRPLTPEWASPEQLRGEPLSTASDVYSLGVLLHVLLVGRRPHAADGLSPEALARRIDESGEPSLAAAASGALPPGVELRALRGDLERVVAKALAPSPAQRYSTAAALAADVGRFLDGRPVEAHPRTLAYRFGKLVRRNPVATFAIALAVVGLLAATAFSLRQAAIADQQRAVAERNFAGLRELAGVLLFDAHDAIKDVAGATAARDKLVSIGARYLEFLAERGDSDVGLQREVAAAYMRLADIQGEPDFANRGDPRTAFQTYAKAIEKYSSVVEARPHDVDALVGLSEASLKRGRIRLMLDGDAEGGATDATQAVTYARRAVSVASESARDRARESLAEALASASYTMSFSGDDSAARAAAEEAVEVAEDLGRRMPDSARARALLAKTYSQSVFFGRQAPDAAFLATSATRARRALDIDLARLASEPTLTVATRRNVAASWNTLGMVESLAGNRSAAVEAFARSLAEVPDQSEDPFNDQMHVDLLRAQMNLARAEVDAGRYVSAMQRLAEPVPALETLIRRNDSLELQYLLGVMEVQLGRIAIAGSAPALPTHERRRQLTSAVKWFDRAAPRFEPIVAAVSLNYWDRMPVEQARDGLARAKSELSRLEH